MLLMIESGFQGELRNINSKKNISSKSLKFPEVVMSR